MKEIRDEHIRAAYRRYMDEKSPPKELIERTLSKMREAERAPRTEGPILRVEPKVRPRRWPRILAVAAAALILVLGLAVVWPLLQKSRQMNMAPKDARPSLLSPVSIKKAADEETAAAKAAPAPVPAPEEEKAAEMAEVPYAAEAEELEEEAVAVPYAAPAIEEQKIAEDEILDEAMEEAVEAEGTMIYADAAAGGETWMPPAEGEEVILMDAAAAPAAPSLAVQSAESFAPLAEYMVQYYQSLGTYTGEVPEIIYDDSPLFADENFRDVFEEALLNAYPKKGNLAKPVYLNLDSAIIEDNGNELSLGFQWSGEFGYGGERIRLKLVNGKWQIK